MPCLSISNLTSNEKIYIRLWEFNNNSTGQFKVRVYANNVATATASISTVPSSLSFGSVQVGTSASQSVTIKNTGSSTLNIHGINKPTGFSCSQSSINVAPGSTQSVSVIFSPTATIGYSGNISFSSNATQGTVSLNVNGTGTSAPQPTISVDPEAIDFGSVSVAAAAVTEDLTISNTGNTSLNISSINTPSGYVLNWTSGNIPAKSDKSIQISFDPASAGSYSGQISINSNATNVTGGVTQVALTGSGLSVQANTITGFVKDLAANPSGNALVEIGLQGATVKLKDAGNQLLATTSTNASGQYSFAGFTGNNFTLEVTLGTYTVVKQGYSTSSVAPVFVIPKTIMYQINQQVSALQNLQLVLAEKGPTYSMPIQGFNTSGMQTVINQSNYIQFSDYSKVKNAIGRIYASQQMLLGYYRNANKVADRASYCLYNAAGVAFSLVETLSKVEIFCYQRLNPAHFPGKQIFALINFLQSEAFDFVTSGLDYYIAIFPNSSSAKAVAEIQSAIHKQLLRIRSNNSVMHYVLSPMSIVYDESAKSMILHCFKEPSQRELNESYASSSNLNAIYLNSLNSVVSSSKTAPLQDETIMNNGVMSSMNNALIFSDAVGQVNKAVGFAQQVSSVTGLAGLAGFLKGVEVFLSSSQIAVCINCFGKGADGVAERRKSYEFSNSTIVYSKTDSLGGSVLANLNDAIQKYNNYAIEIKDNFDYSQDFQGISKLDSLIKLDSAVGWQVHESMIYIMAASQQADSGISGYGNSYIDQLLQNLNTAAVKSIALGTIHLAKTLDTTDVSIDQEIVNATQEMITANNNMRVSITQFVNLLEQFHTLAYPAIQTLVINDETKLGESQTVSVTIKNYGSQSATGVYMVARHDSNFLASPDSIYIGNLGPDARVTVQYQLKSPSIDTVGGYRIDVSSSSPGLFTKGGAILSTSAVTGIEQNNPSINLFNVYPLPVTDLLTIERLSSIEGNVTAVLNDLTGKKILTKEILVATGNKAKIDVSGIPPGTYSLTIITSIGQQVFKILKQ
jgi:hypothetical protein